MSGGTENHLVLVDLRPKGLTGKVAEKALDKAGITVNKNKIPFDPEKPMVTSGMRLGTPAVTTRRMAEPEMKRIAALIDRALQKPDDDQHLQRLKAEVAEMTRAFPSVSLPARGAQTCALAGHHGKNHRQPESAAPDHGGGRSPRTGALPGEAPGSRGRVGLRLADERRGTPSDIPSAAKHFRDILEELGPTFIKFGQVLSTRADLLPPGFALALSDSAGALRADARRCGGVGDTARGLGKPVDALFRSFDRTPRGVRVHRPGAPRGRRWRARRSR